MNAVVNAEVVESGRARVLDVDRIAHLEPPLAALRRRFAGRYPVDPFGLDPQIADLTVPLFEAAVDATEAAIVNALLAARTMTGRDGITAHALPHDRLREVMARYGRAADG